MNIIKFKDLIQTDVTLPDVEFFNTRLRGKYAYWIHCRYVVTLEDVTIDQAVGFEVQIEELLESEIPYVDLHTGNVGHWIYTDGFIDEEETDKINSVEEYLRSNEFVPEDITLDKLKNFRTWLADSLLVFKGELTDNQRHTLDYYANGMIDDTIKWLTEFGAVTVGSVPGVITPSCGCGGSSNISSLYGGSVGICDSISIYKTNLHHSMVEMFSDVDFWSDLNKDFLKQIVLYLQGILKSGLSLVGDAEIPTDTFSCRCLNKKSTAQEVAQGVIEDLIVAFNYIIYNDMNGHKLNILQTLARWSDTLYELMQWD